MRILKYRTFNEWARDEKISDASLRQAVFELENGLYGANLGGGLYKMRVARKGQGKRGAYRTIIAYRLNDRAVFMYGFAKNDSDNMTPQELRVYKKLAKFYLQISDHQVNELIAVGELVEIQQ